MQVKRRGAWPVAALAAICAGCAQVQTYESADTGPRTRINFVSPYPEDRFMSIDGLDLEIMEASASCALTLKVKLELSADAKTATAFVPVNRRAYFSVRQRNTSAFGARNDERQGFSFVPEEGAEYTIVHIDNPARIRLQFYRHDQSGKKQPFEVQGLGACRP
jgi:hypothetical protein